MRRGAARESERHRRRREDAEEERRVSDPPGPGSVEPDLLAHDSQARASSASAPAWTQTPPRSRTASISGGRGDPSPGSRRVEPVRVPENREAAAVLGRPVEQSSAAAARPARGQAEVALFRRASRPSRRAESRRGRVADRARSSRGGTGARCRRGSRRIRESRASCRSGDRRPRAARGSRCGSTRR